MNDVVERVARKISAAMGESWREPPYNKLHTDSLNNGARFIARAAIEAMLTPSPKMVAAGIKALADAYWDDVAESDAIACWSGMLSAALADASPDIGKEGIGNDVR